METIDFNVAVQVTALLKSHRRPLGVLLAPNEAPVVVESVAGLQASKHLAFRTQIGWLRVFHPS